MYKPICIPVNFQPTCEQGTTIMPVVATAPVMKTTMMKGAYCPPNYEPKKPNYTWLWWLLGLVVIVVIGIIWYSVWKRNQELRKAGQQITHAINNRNTSSTANSTVSKTAGNANASKPYVVPTAGALQGNYVQQAQQRAQQMSQKNQGQQRIQTQTQNPQSGAAGGGNVRNYQIGSQQLQVIGNPIEQCKCGPGCKCGQGCECDSDCKCGQGCNCSHESPSSAIKQVKGTYVNQDGSSFGGASSISSKTSNVNDDDLLSFFGDSDAPTPTPGQGMPASFVQGGSNKWRAVPIGPLDEQGKSGSESFDPDCDDALMLPPTITLDQQRKAIQRESAMRSLSSRKGGKNKNMGQQGLWQMINPPADRTGLNKPTGNIAFGISDSYWSASACNNNNPAEIENQFLVPPKINASAFGSQINTYQNPEMNFGGQSNHQGQPYPTGMQQGGFTGMQQGGLSGMGGSGGKASYPSNLNQVDAISKGLQSSTGRISSGLGESEW